MTIIIDNNNDDDDDDNNNNNNNNNANSYRICNAPSSARLISLPYKGHLVSNQSYND